MTPPTAAQRDLFALFGVAPAPRGRSDEKLSVERAVTLAELHVVSGPVARAAAPNGPPPPIPFPRAYTVQVSMDGTMWSAPVAEGRGTASMAIVFAPVLAKFVRITQTAEGENAPMWNMQLMQLYEMRMVNH